VSEFAARPVIVDCDPGHDDALALLLAAGDSRLRLLGVTTVAGNQTLDKTTRNALRILALAGVTDVPVAAGCDRPLVGELTVAEDIHGSSGLAVGLEVDAFWRLLMAAVRKVGGASGPYTG